MHHDPDHALSDGAQSLYPKQYDELVEQIRTIAGVLGRARKRRGSRVGSPGAQARDGRAGCGSGADSSRWLRTLVAALLAATAL